MVISEYFNLKQFARCLFSDPVIYKFLFEFTVKLIILVYSKCKTTCNCDVWTNKSEGDTSYINVNLRALCTWGQAYANRRWLQVPRALEEKGSGSQK